MLLNELSVEFDLLYNNISSNQAPGLTEYEKSVFLTQAQEAVILELYKGVAGDSFESTEEVTRYLNSLVKSKNAVIPKVSNLDKPFNANISIYDFDLKEITDLWFITYQSASILKNNCTRDVIVVPTTQDAMYREMQNPFKGPNENRVLVSSEEDFQKVYTKYPLNNYYIKYLAKPYPIILEDLAEEDEEGNPIGEYLTINKEYKSKEIDWLPEILHRTILLRAVQIAKAVWAS